MSGLNKDFVNSAGVLGCENRCSTGVVKCENIQRRTYILETLVTQASGGNSTGVLGSANRGVRIYVVQA